MGQSASSPGARPSSARKAVHSARIEAVPRAIDGQFDLSSLGQSEPVSQDDFNILKVIGKGSFGKVLLVSKKDTGQPYAMKVLKKEALVKRNQVQHTKAERRILRTCNSPFIVRMHFAFQSAEKLYLVLDYLPGGELFFHLKQERRFEEERVRLYAAELVLALQHLHDKDIVYRDLKPENVLLDEEGHVCLTDFGLSKEAVATGGRTKTFCGTPEYIAPEILQGLGHGKPVDWWSLGTLVYEMLVGLPPFYSTDVKTMYEKILRSELTFPAYVSADARAILSALLQRAPEERLGAGAADSGELMAHRWFSPLDWERVRRREYAPLYRPALCGAGDTSHFDQAFTELPVESLPSEGDGAQHAGAAELAAANLPVFEGFSWEGRPAS